MKRNADMSSCKVAVRTVWFKQILTKINNYPQNYETSNFMKTYLAVPVLLHAYRQMDRLNKLNKHSAES
jgi:hypothetical protein